MLSNYIDILNENRIIQCERILLRQFDKRDYTDVFEYASDEDTVKYLTWPKHQNPEQTKKVIEEFYYAAGNYAIEIPNEKKCIGSINISIDNPNDMIDVGYVINKLYRGHGFALEALHNILCFCFETLKVNRVQCTCFDGNNKSERVLNRCGMSYEGVLRQSKIVKGHCFDVHYYAILRDEYILSVRKESR